MTLLDSLKNLLMLVIQNIDSGNCNLTKEETYEVIDIIKSYTDKTQKLSKYQACSKLNISRATFDNLVREGKLPRGQKVAGFKELFWIEKDLDDFIKSCKS